MKQSSPLRGLAAGEKITRSPSRQHVAHVPRRTLKMRLRQQLIRREAQRVLEAAKFLIAGRIRHSAGFDQREIRLGNPRPPRELVESQAEAAALAADFGSH